MTAYRDADDPDQQSIDALTGEVIELPDPEWLVANAIDPYWMAHFGYSMFHEIHEAGARDGDGQIPSDSMPSGITPPVRYVGVELRYVETAIDGRPLPGRVVIGMEQRAARDFFASVIAMIDAEGGGR